MLNPSVVWSSGLLEGESMGRKQFTLALLFFIFSLNTSLSSASEKDLKYDLLFPLYVKACALTPEQMKGRSPSNPWGHSVLYIKGMCRDRSVNFPKVIRCDSSHDLKDPNSGTLVSASRTLHNSNWVAIERWDVAFEGKL